jgi:hypothetical protein
VEAIAVEDELPVAIGDGALAAHERLGLLGDRLAGADPGAVVLETAADAVGIGHVHANVVVLADGEVIVEVPRSAPIPRGVEASVVADKQVPRVARVDGHRVVIDVRNRGGHPQRPAAVIGHVEVPAEHIHPLIVFGVDPDA